MDAEKGPCRASRARDGQLPPSKHAADLYLACACVLSLNGAVAAFERAYGPVMARVLAHRKTSADIAADVRQMVLERLLVGDVSKGTAPKLSAYRGSGPLQSWVATTAATTLLTIRLRESQAGAARGVEWRRRARSAARPRARLSEAQVQGRRRGGHHRGAGGSSAHETARSCACIWASA
jgi:hypothetical protein